MKYTFNGATGFQGKDRDIQRNDKCHCTFSNLVLKGNCFEAVIFVCAQERGGGGLQPEELAGD